VALPPSPQSPLCYNPPMMKILEIAIEKLKALPEDKQAYAAEVIEHIAASDHGVFHIPDAHRAGVMEGLAQADKGEFATDDQMAALWNSAVYEAQVRAACQSRHCRHLRLYCGAQSKSGDGRRPPY